MSKGIRFELMKNIKSRKNKLLLIGFVMYIVIFIFSLGYREGQYDKNQYAVTEYEMQEYGQMLTIGQMKLNDMKLKKVDKSSEAYINVKDENRFYQSQYDSVVIVRKIFSDRLNKIEETMENRKDVIRANKIKYTGLKEAFEKGIIDNKYLEDRKLSIGKIDKEIEYANYLLEMGALTNVNPYTLNGTSFLKNFFKGSNILIILVFILLFVIDSYVLELGEGSYKSIYTTPVKRNNLLFSKIISPYILVFVGILVIVGISFVIVSLIWGWGELAYPIRVNEGVTKLKLIIESGQQSYVPSYKIMMIQFIGLLVLELFAVVCSISLSVSTNSEMLSFGILLAILMASYAVHEVDLFLNISRLFNPLAYIFYEDLMATNLKINHSYGVLLQVIISALFVVITTLKFKSRDLIGIKGE